MRPPTTAWAVVTVDQYFGTGTAWGGDVHTSLTFGPRYYNRVYKPIPSPCGGTITMMVRFRHQTLGPTSWQLNDCVNPLYNTTASGAIATSNPSKGQCSFNAQEGVGRSSVTCQTTQGLP